MRRLLSLALLTVTLAGRAVAAFADGKPELPKGTAVAYPTSDKKTVVGMSWGPATAPVVILLADVGTGRASLDRLVEPMLARRLAVVELDVRPASAADDVVAAVRALRGSAKAGVGRKVGVFGVGVGASTGLEASKRLPDDVLAAFCLAPKADDASIASCKGLRADLPVAILARSADATDAKKLHTAVVEARKGVADLARLRIVENPPTLDGEKAIVVGAGAAALGTAPLLEAYVAGSFARELATIPDEVLLDGDLAVEGVVGGAWTKAAILRPGRAGGQAWAARVDRRVVFGGWMPKGITMLHLRLRAGAKGLDWAEITGSPIAPRVPHQFLDCVIEAPFNKLRRGNIQIRSGPAAGMPSGEPGAPVRPDDAERGRAPFALAFAPREGGWSFEGEIRVTNVEKVKSPRIEMAWDWLDAAPGMPNISMRPWMDFDMSGPWTEPMTR